MGQGAQEGCVLPQVNSHNHSRPALFPLALGLQESPSPSADTMRSLSAVLATAALAAVNAGSWSVQTPNIGSAGVALSFTSESTGFMPINDVRARVAPLAPSAAASAVNFTAFHVALCRTVWAPL